MKSTRPKKLPITPCFFTRETSYIKESIPIGHPGYILTGITVEVKLDVWKYIIHQPLDIGILVTHPNNVTNTQKEVLVDSSTHQM